MLIENANAPSWVPAAAVVALAATAVSGFFYLRPLESQRPHDPSVILAPQPEFPYARMWQDPLHAISDHWNAVPAPYETIPDVAEFARRIAASGEPGCGSSGGASPTGTVEPQVLRLLVMVPGTPYTDDRETRRRQRHAVVSALTESDFTNETRLHYFHAPSFEDARYRSPSSSPRFSSLSPQTAFRRAGPLRGRSVVDNEAELPSRRTEAATSGRILVGYEEFEPGIENDDHPWTSIQVLWLNSENFDAQPLHRISALAVALDFAPRCPQWTRMAGTTNVLLGPVNSGGLQAMFDEPEPEPAATSAPVVEAFLSRVLDGHHVTTANELDPAAGCAERNALRQLTCLVEPTRRSLRILSTRATVPLDWLACGHRESRCREQYRVNASADDSGQNQTNHSAVSEGSSVVPGAAAREVEIQVARSLRVKSFHSVVVDDRRILRAVVGELRKRGACDRGATRPRIAIVSEQDSVHGRVLDDLAWEVADTLDDRMRASCKPTIVEYGYLRGVDGETRGYGGSRSDGQEEAEGDEVGAGRSPNPFLFGGQHELSFGVEQLDYVRRLSEQIIGGGVGRGARGVSSGVGDESAADVQSPQRLVAIGVLGQDIYDKLLILQALRESRSEMVFFTTDLDARLLDPSVYNWTRNVIVGASYGLTLESDNEISFRDSYQAALFVAVRRAVTLGARGPGGNPEDDALEWAAPKARLFEVGRDYVVELDRDAAAVDHEEMEVLALIGPLLGLALFAFVKRSSMNEGTARVRRRWYGAVATVAAFAAAALYLFVRDVLLELEPWPFLRGVSGVPLVALQITTLVFSVAIVALAHGRARHAQEHVAKELRQKMPPGGWRDFVQGLVSWWSTSEAAEGKQGAIERSKHRIASFWGVVRGTCVSTWRTQLAVEKSGEAKDESGDDRVKKRDENEVRVALWNEFVPYGRWWSRLARSICLPGDSPINTGRKWT